MLCWRVGHDWATFTFTVTSWFWGKKTAEVECPFNHVTWSTSLITGNADFYHLAEVVFVRLFHCQVTLFLPLHIVVFFGRKSLRVTHSSETGSYTPPPWKSNYLCQLSEILLRGKLVYRLTCIQSFNYISMAHRYSFYSLWYNPKRWLTNLLYCSPCYSFGHWKLIPVFFGITSLLWGFFF